MTVSTKKFNVELTEREVNIITSALHTRYMPVKKEHGYSNPEATEVRELRNDFASLVGRYFMGEDA